MISQQRMRNAALEADLVSGTLLSIEFQPSDSSIIAIFEEDRGAQLTLSLSPLLPRPSTTSWPSTTAASLPNHRICTNRIALPVQASFFGEIIKDDIPTVSQQLWLCVK